MSTHYYFGWFTDGFPEKLVGLLHADLVDRRSLVMISANPLIHQDESVGSTERYWLEKAELKFDECHVVDFAVPKEDALAWIQNASAIFLLGGNPAQQNDLLLAYQLRDPIRESRAVVLGTSAGAINMSAKWLCTDYTGGKDGVTNLREGIGLDDFSVLSHYDLENNMETLLRDLSPLSEEMDVFASNKDCAIRVKGNQVDILGDVYLLSKSKMRKLTETL